MNQKIKKKEAYRFKRFARKAFSAFNSMHKEVTIGVVVGCAISFLATSPAMGQEQRRETNDIPQLEKELDEVMVTASRTEQPLNQVAKLVTIITKEQISQAPVVSIQDLLAYAANIDVVQRGGHGVQADISLRGGSGSQTAILLNGINLSNSQTGHYSFDVPFNLSDVERIEIIHGPSGLIYGSSAFSGGINIITKKDSKTPLYLKTEIGQHALWGFDIRGTKTIGSTINSLSIGHNASDGYIANSDYNIYNILWQTRVNCQENSKLDIQLGYNNKKYGANTFYSAAYPNQYEQTSTYLASVKGEFGSKLKFIPIIYWDRHFDQFDLIRNNNFGRNHHRADTYGSNLILLYKSRLGNTSLGNEIRREEIMSSRIGNDMKEPHGKYSKYDGRTNTSLTLEHTLDLYNFVISTGGLLNHNTIVSNSYKLYPAISVSYKPTPKVNIYTSWSKSTRIPTFTDLYYTTETHNGNEGLLPETSSSLDLGFKYRNDFISAYATGFLMWGRNIIDWVKENPDDKKWSSWNLTEINTQGIELGVKIMLSNMIPELGKKSNITVDYARLNQTSNSHGLTSLYSLNYLRDKFVSQLHHSIYKGLSATWVFRFQKRMGYYVEYIDKDKNEKKNYPSFSILDLRLNYEYKDWLLYTNLNNIGNTQYFDIGNIPQAGFWLIGGVSYTLK